MEMIKIMEIIDRWGYLNLEQIALLLNKHIRVVDTLLRDLKTKKLIRVDQLTRKNIYTLSSLGNRKLGKASTFIRINYNELQHQDLLIKWLTQQNDIISYQTEKEFKSESPREKGYPDLLVHFEDKDIDNNSFIWTINGDNQYNPFASKSHIVLADKIMSLFDFTEPHYQAIAHSYLLILLETLVNNKIEMTLSNIIKHFAINDLKNLIDKQNPKYDYVLGFNSQQINGLLSRLNVYNEQLNNSVGLKNDLLKITKNNKVILFSLNSLDYPQLASDMGKLLIQDLKEFVSIKPWNQHINLVLEPV